MDKPLKMTKRHTIPFGTPDKDGVTLTRKEAEDIVQKFKETGVMNVYVEGHGNFKVIGAFLEYHSATHKRGDIIVSGEYEIDIHKKKEQ
jgi:hypothetical protein